MGHLLDRFGRKDEKDAIVHEWCTVLSISSDPKVFEGDVESRRFSNPIAYHIKQASEEVVGYIFSQEDEPSTPQALDDLCRIIALQTAKPSEAFVAFFQLRTIVFSKSRKSSMDEKSADLVNRRIDAIVLEAMDRYTACREQIKQFEINELKKKNRLLESVAQGTGSDRGVA